MSSPIHHAKDLDEALVYAPPWAREEQALREGTLRGQPRSRFDRARAFSGDLAMLELQRQLALEPDAVPEPPADDRPLWFGALAPLALRFCAVTGIAALIAGGVVLIPSMRKGGSGATVAAQATPPASADPELAAPGGNRVKLVHVDLTGAPSQFEPERFVAAIPGDTAVPPQAPSPAAAPQAPTPPEQTAAALAPAELAALIKRGKDLLVQGDFASARLLLRRAAEAGSADAALALGASFDPSLIRKLGAVGAAPDSAKARRWYQRAAELGSPDAGEPLAKLTRAGQ